ncbi:hypothetical protein K1719_030360 [Acacia pycnantha]|nr:hypothetical protein K1719_030360 [Acacia pycnantha]
MRYGLHLPRTSQVGNQVHQDDPINEAVRDAFGVQVDNFTAKVQGPEPVFFRNDAAREFFSLMDESVVLCIKVVEILKVIFYDQIVPNQVLVWDHDKAMSMFTELLRDAFPDADIPSSFSEAKKIINVIRLELRKNRCTAQTYLYALLGRGCSEETCKCHTSRFRAVRKGKKQKKKPAKILRYFPLKPRL